MEIKFELSKQEIIEVTEFVVNARGLSENLSIKNTKKKMIKFAYLTNSKRHYDFSKNLVIDRIANQSFEYSYIRDVQILDNFIMLLTKNFQLSIPKRCFKNKTELDDFIKYIDDKRKEKKVDEENSKKAKIKYTSDRAGFLKISTWIHKFDFKLQETIFKIILGLIILFGLNFLATGIILAMPSVNESFIKANFILYIVLLVAILYIGFTRPDPKFKKLLLNKIDDNKKFITEISIDDTLLTIKDNTGSKTYDAKQIADTFQHLTTTAYIIKTTKNTFEYIYIPKLYYPVYSLINFDKIINKHIEKNKLKDEASTDLKIKKAKIKKLKMLCGIFLFIGIILMIIAFFLASLLLNKI